MMRLWPSPHRRTCQLSTRKPFVGPWTCSTVRMKLCVKSPAHLHNEIKMYEGNRLVIAYLCNPPSLQLPNILHFPSPPPPPTLNPFTPSPSYASHVSLLAFILFAQPFCFASLLFLCLLFIAVFVRPPLTLSPAVLYLCHPLAFLPCSGSQLKHSSSACHLPPDSLSLHHFTITDRRKQELTHTRAHVHTDTFVFACTRSA